MKSVITLGTCVKRRVLLLLLLVLLSLLSLSLLLLLLLLFVEGRVVGDGLKKVNSVQAFLYRWESGNRSWGLVTRSKKLGGDKLKNKTFNINYLLLIQLRVFPLCMPVCPNIHSFFSICMFLSLCLSVHLSVFSVYYSKHLTINMSDHSYFFVTLFVCLSVCLSVLSV
jgi:hypothetical protein